MKKPIQTLVAIAVFGLGSLAAHAQPAVKLLVVDMAKLYDGHYRTVEHLAKLKRNDDLAGVEVGKMRAEGTALVETYKSQAEQATSALLSQDAKTKIQAEAQKTYAAIQQKEEALNAFVQDVRQRLGQENQQFRATMLEELTKIASDAGKRKGATLLIDKSGPSAYGISNVIYTDPAYDITDEIMKEIEKTKPATPPPAPAATAPGTTSPMAPAADAPRITVPIAPKK